MRGAGGVVMVVSLLTASPLVAGYRAHRNDSDLEAFLTANPSSRGGRLDSCALCHPGGQVTGKKDERRLVDGCTYCHDVYKLQPPHGPVPLNPYGSDYLKAGRDVAAVRSILGLDSDDDGLSNWKEVLRRSFPGDACDHPGLARAPARYFDREALGRLARTSATVLVNTHKSGDYYATYGGVTFEELMRAAKVAPSAERVTFFCPDGYCLTVPLRAADGYRLLGPYPQGTFPEGLEWVEYPRDPRLKGGQPLPGEPRALLAFERDGRPLPPAELVKQDGTRWVLSAEGPFRLILPQAVPSAPDQPSSRAYPGRPFPFADSLDHNGGACVRCVVAQRFDPLPAGTTDVDWGLEGWRLVERGQMVVYGALEAE